MSVRLVLLGLLHDKPLYGYEIKGIIEEHMGDWTSIAFGSIYFALDKLTEEKFVEKVATEQHGNRPSRSVYQITDAGRAEFLRLLRAGWQDRERQYYEIDVCLFFLERLPRTEVLAYLEQRMEELNRTLSYLARHEEEQMSAPHIPPQARAIFAHTRAHVRAEHEWTHELLESLRSEA